MDPAGKWQVFGEADAALIASGTVSLELALSGVPMISCYKLDPVMQLAQGLVQVWSGVLPNLIADRPIVPEAYNRYVQPLMPGGDWLAADEATLAALRRRLDEVEPAGSTDHVSALRQALAAGPDALVWVTDADDLTEAAVREVTRLPSSQASGAAS